MGAQPMGFVSPPAGPAVQQLSMQTGLDPVILHSIVTDGDTDDIAPMYEFRIQALEQQSRPQSIGEMIQQWRQKDQWNGQPIPLGR